MSKLPPQLEGYWRELLSPAFETTWMQELIGFLRSERSEETIYPPSSLVFNALNQTPYEKVKVLIMGQDPYHGAGQAHGLSFSVPSSQNIPPSLRNIFLEIKEDLGIAPPSKGDLSPWAKQGVLLLNATLTVRAKQARSHYGRGWERLTNLIISKLAERAEPLVFLLWGRSAKEKVLSVEALSQNPQHLILEAAHPSPFSAHAGFFGSKHFSKSNAFLKEQGQEAIDWSL